MSWKQTTTIFRDGFYRCLKFGQFGKTEARELISFKLVRCKRGEIT